VLYTAPLSVSRAAARLTTIRQIIREAAIGKQSVCGPPERVGRARVDANPPATVPSDGRSIIEIGITRTLILLWL